MKKLFIKIYNSKSEYEFIMKLSSLSNWIKQENDMEFIEGKEPIYTITPVWMTQSEYDKLTDDLLG